MSRQTLIEHIRGKVGTAGKTGWAAKNNEKTFQAGLMTLGVLIKAEFMEKLSDERAVYQAMLEKMG